MMEERPVPVRCLTVPTLLLSPARRTKEVEVGQRVVEMERMGAGSATVKSKSAPGRMSKYPRTYLFCCPQALLHFSVNVSIHTML